MVNAQTRLASLLRGSAAAAFAALAAALPAQVAPGSVFPPIAAAGLTGGALRETAGKVVLVDFWASWCGPCKASFPAYARLSAAYAERGLVIAAVSVDESPSAYAAFVARLKPPFATLHDSKQALVRVVQVPTMPTSYLVDRTGRVRFIHPGFHGEQTERELRGEIEALLSEKAPLP
jgi:thiol-disulfide isomerase/thioredoxin